MPALPSNVFEPGEQADIIVKRNETFRRGFVLEEPLLDIDGNVVLDANGKTTWTPIDLTGATIAGGIKKAYDDPTLLVAFMIYDRDSAAGAFFVKCDLGLAGGKLTAAVWDVVVVLSDGRKIRAGAGVVAISFGVVDVPA